MGRRRARAESPESRSERKILLEQLYAALQEQKPGRRAQIRLFPVNEVFEKLRKSDYHRHNSDQSCPGHHALFLLNYQRFVEHQEKRRQDQRSRLDHQDQQKLCDREEEQILFGRVERSFH